MDGLSVFAPYRRNSNRDDSPLVKLVRAFVEREENVGRWEMRFGDIWCFMEPSEHRKRDQGWKLHIAATPSSAYAILERALEVLVRHRCGFKFASTLESLAQMNSRQYSRGGAGKFITVYPDSDEQFRQLAEELDNAIAGLPGPVILSDRPYRPGSLVHYRYGGFIGRMVLSNDSDYRLMLQCPDGSLIEDRREAWFTPPAWAPSPFGEPEAPQVRTAGTQQVLLADRFVVREAIRHANKGGVYRATDRQTGSEVIIKEARPFIEVNEAGRDIRDLMRNEAELLDVLAPFGVAPRKLGLFEQGGHLFLAEELVPGVPLARWGTEQMAGDPPGLPWSLTVTLARQLAELLAVVHTAGLVLRDLTPNNVMVAPDSQLKIIDLELAAAPGTIMQAAGTPGYAAPEQLAGAPAGVEADLFGLGAIIFTLATGSAPIFLDDEPLIRPLEVRLEHWLNTMTEANEAARRLKPLILGTMDAAPEQRWDLGRVRAFLNNAEEQTPASSIPGVPEPEPSSRRLTPGDQERLITDGVEHLLASMRPNQDRLWPSTCFGATSDPCNVHYGAAGVLAVLTQAAQLARQGVVREDNPDFSERVHAAVRSACEWIERRLSDEPLLLPGLHFGRSGTAWALFDAARLLGDESMADRALSLAKRIPVSWPNPDMTHGVAGAGLVQLYLWQATGDPELGQRTQRCADQLVAVVERQPSEVLWRVPASFDSRFAGGVHYGFAHGVAGIAWFLLAMGLVTGRDDCLELARAAGDTLGAAAQIEDGAATWGERPGDELRKLVHWCHGSSGIGTFLIRLWQANGDERFRELAAMAAVAVRRGKWRATSCLCHGLAGNGEFLLDIADALDEPRYHAWAEELGAVLFARHALREGRMVIPDESGTGLAADYGVGLAGVVAFLLRLRHGGPRMWMADPEASLLTAGVTR